MKSNIFRVGAAALALVVCLTIAPIVTARPASAANATVTESWDRFDLGARIAKIIKKLKSLPGVRSFEDQPGPPLPKP